MKKIIYIMMTFAAVASLLCGCSSKEDTPSQTDGWNILLTRAGMGWVDKVLAISGVDDQYDPSTLATLPDFSKLFTFSNDAGTLGTWNDNTSPSWVDGEQKHVVAYYSEGDYAVAKVPTSIDATVSTRHQDQISYLPSTTKADARFSLQYMLGMLKIYIKVVDSEGNISETVPCDFAATLKKSADISYTTTGLVYLVNPETFSQSATFSGPSAEGNFVSEDIYVLPFSYESSSYSPGNPFLRFKVGSEQYSFVPESDITFTAGKKTNLYLGVAAEEKRITLLGVSVNNWESGAVVDGGEAE